MWKLFLITLEYLPKILFSSHIVFLLLINEYLQSTEMLFSMKVNVYLGVFFHIIP